jgi:hypothetical protein
MRYTASANNIVGFLVEEENWFVFMLHHLLIDVIAF